MAVCNLKDRQSQNIAVLSQKNKSAMVKQRSPCNEKYVFDYVITAYNQSSKYQKMKIFSKKIAVLHIKKKLSSK